MNQDILNYLRTQRIGVLAVEMPDGSPHAATVHFANSEQPFVFYFETSKNSRKAQAFAGSRQARASFVIGSTENDMKTMQLDGIIRQPQEGELEGFQKIYLGKFSEKGQKMSNPENFPLIFMPSWWRYTDWHGPSGKIILTSE